MKHKITVIAISFIALLIGFPAMADPHGHGPAPRGPERGHEEHRDYDHHRGHYEGGIWIEIGPEPFYPAYPGPVVIVPGPIPYQQPAPGFFCRTWVLSSDAFGRPYYACIY